MAKNQAKQETAAAEETEAWSADDATDFDEAANGNRRVAPAPQQLDMRHKLENRIESLKLQKQISDYEFLDVDEIPARQTNQRSR